MPGFNKNLKGYNYDPEKAKQLLREAGCPDGFETVLWLQDDLMDRRIAEAIQQQLKEIGITVKLNPVASATFLDAVGRREKKVPCNLIGWYQDYPDPGDFLDVLLNGEKMTDVECNNVSFYDNPRVNKILNEAAHCTDPQQRFKLYQQAEELIVREAPWVFLFHPYLYALRQPWLGGLKLHPVWPLRYERMWVER